MTFAAPVRILASRLPASSTYLVGTLRVVPAPISAALANALARLRGCI